MSNVVYYWQSYPAMHHYRFTVIEILIIAGTIAALAGGVVVVLNPSKQFAQARNTHRQANVSALVQAIDQRIADHHGTWDPHCGTAMVTLPSTVTAIGSETSGVNLEPCLVTGYLASMVTDPSVGTDSWTGYTLLRTANGHVTVTAPYAELGEEISATQ